VQYNTGYTALLHVTMGTRRWQVISTLIHRWYGRAPFDYPTSAAQTGGTTRSGLHQARLPGCGGVLCSRQSGSRLVYRVELQLVPVFPGVADDQIQHLHVRLDPTHARIASDFLVSQVVVYESCVAEEFLAKEVRVRQVLADELEVLVERVVCVEIDGVPVGIVSE
jgi:hypothetical protein